MSAVAEALDTVRPVIERISDEVRELCELSLEEHDRRRCTYASSRRRASTMGVVMPTVPDGVSMHTWAVTACGGMSIGLKGALAATDVLTRTAFEVLTHEELRAAARADFERRTEGFEYVSPIPEGQTGPHGYQLPASPP